MLGSFRLVILALSAEDSANPITFLSNHALNHDSAVQDIKHLLPALNQQIVYHNFNFGEFGFSRVNRLILKEIDSFDMPNIGIEAKDYRCSIFYGQLSRRLGGST
jgi:hypothetical protein